MKHSWSGCDSFLDEDMSQAKHHFLLTIKEHPEIYRWVRSHNYSPSVGVPEPLLVSFRNFLGHMMAVYFFTSLGGSAPMKLGGVAYAFTCHPDHITGTLSAIQNRQIPAPTPFLCSASRRQRNGLLRHQDNPLPLSSLWPCSSCSPSTYPILRTLPCRWTSPHHSQHRGLHTSPEPTH